MPITNTHSFRVAEHLAARLAVKKRLHHVALSQNTDEVVMPCEAFWNDSDEYALEMFENLKKQLESL
jgi:hypothetical protein